MHHLSTFNKLAVAQSQPYGVFCPLLLLGFLGVVLGTVFLTVARRRYQAYELRRMRAMDS